MQQRGYVRFTARRAGTDHLEAAAAGLIKRGIGAHEVYDPPVAARAVLFDVDGTLLDVLANQRGVWHAWADRYGLGRGRVYECAIRTVPRETFAIVAPDRDPDQCPATLHELEDEDARAGTYAAFAGARELLWGLLVGAWGVVTSNYATGWRSASVESVFPNRRWWSMRKASSAASRILRATSRQPGDLGWPRSSAWCARPAYALAWMPE
jgi:hypothetical protein